MIERLNRLDHLRFLAAFAVMSWHFTHGYVGTSVPLRYWVFSVIEEGHTGVAFFCVISGFIFAWLYGDKSISYGNFIRKRALRILPMFVVLVLLTYFIIGNEAWPLNEVLGMLTTIHQGALKGYIAPGWSVLLEFQFYLLFPFLIVFLRKYGLLYLVSLFLLAVAVRGVVWLSVDAVWLLSYWTMFGRIDQFLMGMVAGVICKDLVATGGQRAHWMAVLLGAIASLVIVSVYIPFNLAGGYQELGNTHFLWIFIPAVEGICYAFITAGYILMPRTPQVAGGGITNTISFLGRISYSMYLTHLLVFSVVNRNLPASFISDWESAMAAYILVALPAVVVLSAATYYLIERPFMDLGRSLDPARLPRESTSEGAASGKNIPIAARGVVA